jgi:transcription initiation factor IIE alpha subunit
VRHLQQITVQVLTMRIELSRDEAEALRILLQERIVELDKEINRTDAFKYKAWLQKLDRTIERILGELNIALDHDQVPM